jgi:hypothetical protein
MLDCNFEVGSLIVAFLKLILAHVKRALPQVIEEPRLGQRED